MSSAAKRKEKADPWRELARNPTLSGGVPPSATYRRWLDRYSEIPRYSVIGRATGLSGQAVRLVIHEERHWRDAQEAVAKFAGVSVEELFGDAAWHVKAGRALAERQRVAV